MTPEQAAALTRCLERGGVAVFPADTVYGLGCDPESSTAVQRLYRLKGRDSGKPAAVMFFDVDQALEAVALAPRTAAAARALLPGPVTLLLPNPDRHFPLACGPRPEALGLRVPDVGGPACPLLQSSANPSGGHDARRLEDVDPALRAGADLSIDGGELPGTPSTVVDLLDFEASGAWRILRAGAAPAETLERALSSQAR